MADTIAISDIYVREAGMLREAQVKTQEFEELTASIAAQGILFPILVKRNAEPVEGKNFTLIDGLQRFTAAGQVGLTEVPALIQAPKSEAEEILLQITANTHRIETKKAALSAGLKKIIALSEGKITKVQLASSLSRSVAYVDGLLSLDNLVEPAKLLVDNGGVSLMNALELAKLPVEEQSELLDSAAQMTSDEFNLHVKEHRQATRAARAKVGAVPTFQPHAAIRPRADLLTALQDPTPVMSVLDTHTEEVAPTYAKLDDKRKPIYREGLEAGVRLALGWVVKLDPATVAQAKAEFDADVEAKRQKAEARRADAAAKAAARVQEARASARG